MSLFFLLPPSEWKNEWWDRGWQFLSVSDLPLSLAQNATEKDLKCSGKRYEEGITLNKSLLTSPVLPAIDRYSWVMYWALDFVGMSNLTQSYFNNHFFIVSALYGLLKPQDLIANYKLPVGTKWLKMRRWDKITDQLIDYVGEGSYVVDALSWPYRALFKKKRLEEAWVKYVCLDFYKKDWSEVKKFTHWVKKIKWQFLKECCEKWYSTLDGIWQVDKKWHVSLIFDV